MALSPKQRRFVDAYVIDLNATSAAIAAGYSKRTARQQGSRLLTNVDIAAAVAEALANRQAASIAKAERRPMTLADVRAELEKIAKADIRDVVKWRSNVLATVEDPDSGEVTLAHVNDVELVNSEDVPDDVATAIGEISKSANGSLKIKLLDKRGALIALERSLSEEARRGAGKPAGTEARPPAPGAPPSSDDWADVLATGRPN
jgi:phage terminase small subunit